MKKLFVIVALIGLFTSCSSTEIESQEMPPMEQEWSDTMLNWYPDWVPPIIIHKN
jgi:hypothetical protein